MICDMIVILKDTDTTNMPELIKIVEEKGGSIFSIKDINEKCSMCGIPCFYVFFSFSIPILNFCELENEFKRIPYYVTCKPLHAY